MHVFVLGEVISPSHSAKKAKTNGIVKPTIRDDRSSDLSSALDREEKPKVKKKRKPRTKEEKVGSSSELTPVPDEGEESKPQKKRKRKTKEKEAEAMPLALRTAGLNMFVGAYVSRPLLHPELYLCLLRTNLRLY